MTLRKAKEDLDPKMIRQRKYNDKVIRDSFLKDSNFEVTSEGKILSYRSQQGWPISTPRELTTAKDGFRFVRYGDKKLFTHRIVYEKFVGRLDPELNVTHKDGNKLNNHPFNLELCTQSDTGFHRFDEQIYNQPAVIGHHKNSKKEEARELRRQGRSVKEIERELKVSRSSVSIWVRGIELTKEQKFRLKQKQSANGGWK